MSQHDWVEHVLYTLELNAHHWRQYIDHVPFGKLLKVIQCLLYSLVLVTKL